MRSGWCSAPTGARPQHEWCRSAVCRCECHGAETPAVERDSASDVLAITGATCENGGTNQDGPGGSQLALQAVIPGPRRSSKEID